MAGVILCECCGRVLDAPKSLHVRVFRNASATEHYSRPEDFFDVCKTCYTNIELMLKHKENKNDK